MGNQPQYGPKTVSPFGGIELSLDRKSIKGEGLLFFYAQCITGDGVDTVPGLGGAGAVKAFKLLEGSVDELDAFKRVLEAYRGVHGPLAEEKLLEQGRLLWMTKTLDKEGHPVLWEMPKEEMVDNGLKDVSIPSSNLLSDQPA
jgi:5'-3' exonuclease